MQDIISAKYKQIRLKLPGHYGIQQFKTSEERPMFNKELLKFLDVYTHRESY